MSLSEAFASTSGMLVLQNNVMLLWSWSLAEYVFYCKLVFCGSHRTGDYQLKFTFVEKRDREFYWKKQQQRLWTSNVSLESTHTLLAKDNFLEDNFKCSP